MENITETPHIISPLPPTVEVVEKPKKKRIIFISGICLLIVIPVVLFFLGSKQLVHNATERLLSPFTASKSSTQRNEVTQSTNPTSSVATQQKLTDSELLAMADNKYVNGNLPLGDNNYVTSGPKKGYIYLCNAHAESGGGGAQVNGNWIHDTTWNITQKVSVQGSISWPGAKFSNSVTGSQRVFVGNDLPLHHTTGVFPIASADPAYTYDRNPNAISAQTFQEAVSAHPSYSDTPYCMGGEVGIMLSGVALFNGFDAGLRDAAAHEVQDTCGGHPQNKGEYHYHSLSSCFQDTNVKTVLGYALDGFPITGPLVVKDKYLTTEDLDECHGITSDIIMDGKTVTTYHYVMTQDFPYSASCFRSKPTQPSGSMQQSSQNQDIQQSQGQRQQPPQEAISACSGKSQGNTCSFTTPHGDTITGTCDTPPSSSLACIPAR